MRTIPSSYQLSELGADDCWLLFAKHAFSDGVVDPDLEGIGKEIVSKCGGLPLAAKTLGGLLRCERDGAKWKKIAGSNIWESSHHILPSLRISYQCLPSKMKQLFAYCAIFPKDRPFEREDLIRLWMAEGFLVEAGEEEEMEAAGYEYFDQFVFTSFFQEFKGYSGEEYFEQTRPPKSPLSEIIDWFESPSSFFLQSSRGSSLYIMHDLVNDLAKSVSEGFSGRFEGDKLSMISKSTRYLSCGFVLGVVGTIFRVHEAKLLSTLFLGGSINSIEVANFLPNLRRLRVLSLQICYLPDSISNLKHLRYLNLQRSLIRNLPDTICGLYNLQTLILFDCKNLVELPMKMGMLINLTYLDIRGIKGLKEMPPHMDRLKKLQLLTDFVVGKMGAYSINELRELQQLRGSLHVQNLENVVDTNPETLKDILKHKALLEELKLEWQGETQDTLHERRILEQLQPHASIKRLSLFNYRGTTFPDWVGDSSFSNIISLQLHGCKNCISLPPLGQLESLQELSISNFDSVIKLGPEFLGSSSNSVKKPFQSLKYLKFQNMPHWQDWIVDQEDEVGAFPNLQRLQMKNCPILKSLPKLPPSLEVLKIYRCDQLELAVVLPMAQKICSMEIQNSSCKLSSELLDNEVLNVSIEAWDRSIYSLIVSLSTMPTFERLMVDFDSFNVLLERMPSGMYHLKNNGNTAHSLFPIIPEKVDAITVIEEVQIQSCSLERFLLELFPNLKMLEISDCQYLDSLSSGVLPLRYFTSLSSLNIRNCNSLVSFPEGGLPAPNLATFRISNCSNLMSLPAFMHLLLPSLVHLHIDNCPKLESFPGGTLPSNLQALSVHQCYKLMSGRVQWDLQNCCSSLSEFEFQGYVGSDVHSFPEARLLPPSLKSFVIQDLENLKFLNYLGLAHLTSLEKFKIIDCSELRYLPDAGLPTSLSSLVIRGCPLLARSCEPESGEDWLKISHISRVEIESKTIQGSP